MTTPPENDTMLRALATQLQHPPADVEKAFHSAPQNVCMVLRRQYFHTVDPKPERPVCKLQSERELFAALTVLPLELALFTLARLYDECHITLCKALAAVRGGRSHNERFRQRPSVELGPLCHRLTSQPDAMSDQIVLQATSNENVHMEAVWKPVVPMAFDHLPKLQSLSGLLPGEQASSQLGHLLQRHGKQMDVLMSTRTWATGSQ
ncbi:hypothetical protein LTR80_012129, partial [Exophiala xenobiotica]